MGLLLGCTTPSYQDAPDTYSGSQLYESFCASCHGPWGNGDGRVASYLSIPVPDLTHIAARNGGEFPEQEIFRVIDGRSEHPAHGTSRMPVWGYEFASDVSQSDTAASEQAERTIERLVAYLRSIQESDKP